MEKTFAKVEDLAGHLKEYINNRVTSLKMSAAEKTSRILSTVLAFTFLLLVFLLVAIFLGIALAIAFTKLTGEYFWGFLIVAVIYMLLGILVWRAKEKLLQLPIMNALLQQLFTGEDEEEDNEED